MANDTWYAGGRKPYVVGDSVVVSLPKKELKRRGIEPEDLTEGEDCELNVIGEGNELTISLPAGSD